LHQLVPGRIFIACFQQQDDGMISLIQSVLLIANACKYTWRHPVSRQIVFQPNIIDLMQVSRQYSGYRVQFMSMITLYSFFAVW
jgi:hypothetical protein